MITLENELMTDQLDASLAKRNSNKNIIETQLNALLDSVGDVESALDAINGEVI